jgi:ABC-type branched-subunit amino acid transport system substrate-binding protein
MSAVVGPGPTAPAGAEVAEADPRGVTRASVTVAGIVTGDATTSGADVGAQARFLRENLRGGVFGRRIVITGVESDGGAAAANSAAVTKLAGSVFALVPVLTPVLDVAALERIGLPFFGAATSTAWTGSRFGFGFTGAQAVERPVLASPAWGRTLRTLLGTTNGKTAIVAVDATPLGTSFAAQAGASLRATGFRVLDPVTVPAGTDPGAIAPTLAASKPDVILVLTSSATAASLAARIGALGFTGTIGSQALYDPANPAIANGVTALTTTAPFEQDTAATRQMIADVKAIRPEQPVTPAVAGGYWSADLFVAALRATGRNLTVSRFLAAANKDFHHEVPATVGPTTWPAMHATGVPCGALVQSDGTRYFLAVPYTCGKPVRVSTGKAHR